LLLIALVKVLSDRPLRAAIDRQYWRDAAVADTLNHSTHVKGGAGNQQQFARGKPSNAIWRQKIAMHRFAIQRAITADALKPIAFPMHSVAT